MYLNPSQGYLDLLRNHHRVTVEVYILNSARQYLFDITKDLVSGTLDIDVEGETSRFGKMVVLDPQQRLSIDLNGIGWGSNMSNRLIQIWHRVWSMDWSETYAVPIFTGPISDSDRDGVLLNLQFKGLESLVGEVLFDYSWPAGWQRSAIIMDAVRISSGEMNFADNSGGSQWMHSAWSVEGGENLWARVKSLADGGGLNIYFDGAGVLQIKQKNRVPVAYIDSTWLIEEPDQSLDISKLRNVVRVEGANIPGTDQKMFYEAWPPPQHPFSPQSLARNGVLRAIPHRISESSLGVWQDLIDTAWRNLEWDLLVAESNTAVIATLPFLEEYDVLTIAHPKLYANSPLTKATIPLVGDGTMSLNMFTTTSSGQSSRGGRAVSNKGAIGGQRLINGHGPSGAFNTLGGRGRKGRGQNLYALGKPDQGAPNKSKGKKNRNKKGGK
jgi:hypothetical protein